MNYYLILIYWVLCDARVADLSLTFVKNTLILSYPAKIAVEVVDIFKIYGLSGLAGILMRKDFVEAVETLKRISGMVRYNLPTCLYISLLTIF